MKVLPCYALFPKTHTLQTGPVPDNKLYVSHGNSWYKKLIYDKYSGYNEDTARK